MFTYNSKGMMTRRFVTGREGGGGNFWVGAQGHKGLRLAWPCSIVRVSSYRAPFTPLKWAKVLHSEVPLTLLLVCLSCYHLFIYLFVYSCVIEEKLNLEELNDALGSPLHDLPPVVRRRVDALQNLHVCMLQVFFEMACVHL